MKKLTDLTPEQQAEAVAAFRDAVASRARQWEAEARLEDLLDGDPKLLIQDLAVMVDDPDEYAPTIEDLAQALEDQDTEDTED